MWMYLTFSWDNHVVFYLVDFPLCCIDQAVFWKIIWEQLFIQYLSKPSRYCKLHKLWRRVPVIPELRWRHYCHCDDLIKLLPVHPTGISGLLQYKQDCNQSLLHLWPIPTPVRLKEHSVFECSSPFLIFRLFCHLPLISCFCLLPCLCYLYFWYLHTQYM